MEETPPPPARDEIPFADDLVTDRAWDSYSLSLCLCGSASGGIGFLIRFWGGRGVDFERAPNRKLIELARGFLRG